MIRKASINDLNQIVAVHLSSFDGFFLSSLGRGFLMTFYREFVIDSNGCCFVFVDRNKIVGFVAGVINPSEFFRRTFRKRFIPLALGTLRRILKQPSIIIKLIRRAATYPDKSQASEKFALLSSIAVLPEYSNKNIGENLVRKFLSEVRNMGAEEVTLTTDKHNNEKVVRFYRKMGFKINETFTGYEGREMYEFIIRLNNDQPEMRKELG